MRAAGPRLLVLLLLLSHALLVMHGALRHSPVFDEVVYPTSGYAYLTTGDYRMNPEHPPLLKLWTGLAWLGTGLQAEATPGWQATDQWLFGQSMIFESGHDPQRLLGRARFMIALLSVALGAAVFGITRRLCGEAGGVVAVCLYAFDPLVIAHGGLATTDLGAAAFYFLAALAVAPAMTRGGLLRLAVASLLIGCALAAKFSTLALLAVLVAAALATRWETPSAEHARPGAGLLLGRLLGIVLGAVAVVTAVYGPAGPGLYLDGLRVLGVHGEVGHPTYAFGHYSEQGWWWYFPASWAVKTPLPVLLASLVGIVFLVRRLRGSPVLAVTLLLSPALVVAGAMASSLNLGVRHLLPVTPFLAVAGGMAAARLWRIGRKGRAVVGIALGWLVAGTLLAHPDELAYSNEMAGGPSRTWRALADSNVDWGQSLPALAHEIGRHPLRRLYLGYLGTAEPQAYGLSRYHWIPSFGMVERRFLDGPDPDGREWIAISVTNLLEVYTRRHDGYAWLRERPLTALPGHSIALFDITGDGEAHRRIGESAIRFGEPRAAEAPLRRALELAPEDGRIHLDLARVLATLGRWPEAVARCDDAERLLPESAEARELCERLREEAHRVSSEGSRDRPPPTKPQDRP